MILTLLACSTSEPGIGGGGQDTSFDYVATSPELQGQDAAARAQSLLDAGLPAGATLVQSWTDIVDTYADAQCPERVDYSMLDAPFGCASSTGAYFSGMTGLKHVGNSIELVCDAYVVTPDGERFECGGEIIQLVDPSGRGRWTLMVGTFGWMSQPLQSGGAYSAALRIEARTDGTLVLNGGLGHSGLAINFEALEWRGEVRGGALSVHSDEGWYRSVLGPAGCGSWVFEAGGAVGQGCVELEPAIQAWLTGVGL